jgi:hypothetical protein
MLVKIMAASMNPGAKRPIGLLFFSYFQRFYAALEDLLVDPCTKNKHYDPIFVFWLGEIQLRRVAPP